MSGWKDLLIDILKLTDEVKRLNENVNRINDHVMDMDKRLVRLETMVEIARMQPITPGKPQIEN